MNRREFLHRTAVGVSLAAMPQLPNDNGRPEIPLTFDDPTTEDRANLNWQEINQRILDSLAKYKIKSALFVCGKRVDSDAGHRLVTAWDGRGHLICNHSYSHLNFNGDVTLDAFESDALKNEPLIRSYTNFAAL